MECYDQKQNETRKMYLLREKGNVIHEMITRRFCICLCVRRKNLQKLKEDDKLRRDKYGRRVDKRGKPIQKLKPFQVCITTKEAKGYHSNIIA